MQIKVTVRYHFTDVGIASMRNPRTSQGSWEFGENDPSIHCWFKCHFGSASVENSVEISQKKSSFLPYDLVILLFGIYIENIKII